MRPTVPAIYLESFATIRGRGRSAALPPTRKRVAVGMIHAARSGGAGKARYSYFLKIMAQDCAGGAGRTARPILCDAHRVLRRRSHARFCPPTTRCICTLRDPRVPDNGGKQMATRALPQRWKLWRPHLGRAALVAIGNAPTARFHHAQYCSEDPDCPRPCRPFIGLPRGGFCRCG